MIRHLTAGLMVVFIFFGCASDPQPKPDFQDGTRVGIFNSVESYLTHRHITIERINSFTQQRMDNFNWPADISNIPKSELNKIRPRIKAYADQAVKNALVGAQMISAE